MSIELWTWNTPNGRKISVALEEMGLPYTVKPVNISKGEQFGEAFLKISPNNKIPAIIDSDGPGGKPISIFESGAILIYLGEKTGKFWPKGDMRRQVPVLEWLMWQMGGFGPIPGQVHHFLQVEKEEDRRYGLDRYMKETHRLYGVFDKRLGEAQYAAGNDVSIADFAILGWAWRHERHQVELERLPQRQALVRGDDGAPRHKARLRGGAELTAKRSSRRRPGSMNTACWNMASGLAAMRHLGCEVMEKPIPLLRSFLFAPGNHARRVEKALSLDADAVILDLEDAVATAEKLATRDAIAAALLQPRTGLLYVRVNAADTEFCYGDLVAVVRPGLDGIILPKVESAADARDDRLAPARSSSASAALPQARSI